MDKQHNGLRSDHCLTMDNHGSPHLGQHPSNSCSNTCDVCEDIDDIVSTFLGFTPSHHLVGVVCHTGTIVLVGCWDLESISEQGVPEELAELKHPARVHLVSYGHHGDTQAIVDTVMHSLDHTVVVDSR